MKPSKHQILKAAARLTALAMYPTNPAAHAEIMSILARMVPHEEALDWLVGAMIDRVGEWKGTAQLRALLCTRWAPADGIEGPTCEITGFTPSDNESQSLIEHEDQKSLMKPDRSPLQAKRLN